MVLIDIYINTPLCLLSQFDVSSRISKNDLKCSLRGERVVKENGGPWHAMGAPYPSLRGMAGQTDAVGRRGMGSKTCKSPTVGHKQLTGACSQRTGSARQRTSRARVARRQCAGNIQAVRTGYTDIGQ